MTHSMVELRKERNITQEELASEIGMSKGAIIAFLPDSINDKYVWLIFKTEANSDCVI